MEAAGVGPQDFEQIITKGHSDEDDGFGDEVRCRVLLSWLVRVVRGSASLVRVVAAKRARPLPRDPPRRRGRGLTVSVPANRMMEKIRLTNRIESNRIEWLLISPHLICWRASNANACLGMRSNRME